MWESSWPGIFHDLSKERMEEIGMTIVLVTILQMISVSLHEECNVLRHLSTAPKGLARNRHSLHG
jgi:hypothetical protein